VLIGNLLKIKVGEFFPCDMVILSTADEKGRCYIETKNLDGETNKKIKFSHKDIFPFTKDLSKIDYSDIKTWKLNYEGPNAIINKFTGAMSISK
jgi:magnesium-transporting ATPase (P-type)